MLVWDEFIERATEELQRAILSLAASNPFIDRLSSRQARRWLGNTNARVAELVMRRLGASCGLQTVESPLGPSLELPETWRGKPLAADAAVWHEIHARMQRGEGAGRRGLHELYPGQIHVIEQMFVAELLLEAPDGYVFTRSELEDHLRKLAADRGDASEVGLKEIKTLLGLQRRPAEGLRSFVTGSLVSGQEKEQSGQSGSAP
jgi:hypothetical protein